jgi:site-specific DNA recombinase
VRKGSRQVRGGQTVWNIALYIRLSRDDGNDESLSVTNQRKILTEYVEKEFKEPYELVDYYIDDGRTGTDYERPDFQRMMHDVETGRVSCIICKNLARAFRNYADQGYFLESFFPRHGTRFITLGEPKIDTYLHPEAISGLEVPINGLMNDRFAAQTSSSVRRTLDSKRRNGEFIGAFAPYGYKKHPHDKNALVIDEEAAEVVRDIFHWFVYGDGASAKGGAEGKGGLSKEGIAKKLNEMGVPNPTLYKARKGLKYKNPNAGQNDGLWTGASVSRILSNKVYTGTMVQGRQRVISYKVHDVVNVPPEEWFEVENTHEAIVPKALFEKAQALQERMTRAPPGKRRTHLFSGLLKCADCGKSMTRRASGGYVYYTCSTYKRKSKEKCTRHTLRLDALEQAVLLALQRLIALTVDFDELKKALKRVPAPRKKSTRLKNLLRHREQELSKTEDFLLELYMDWKSGEISREQYRAMKEKFERQAQQLHGAIRNIREEIVAAEREWEEGDPYLEAFLQHGNIQSLAQGLLTELIETIYVHEGGQITIVFKTEDPLQGPLHGISEKTPPP